MTDAYIHVYGGKARVPKHYAGQCIHVSIHTLYKTFVFLSLIPGSTNDNVFPKEDNKYMCMYLLNDKENTFYSRFHIPMVKI